MDDLDRLHQHLVDALREGFPHLLGRRFRLRDIPEHFVEYRKRRSQLGYQSAAQYELALMRLASGERGYLLGDPTAQEAFRRALAGPEPDASLLKQHADAQVWLADGGEMPATAPSAAAAESGVGPVAAPRLEMRADPLVAEPVDATLPTAYPDLATRIPPVAPAEAAPATPPPPPPPPPHPPAPRRDAGGQTIATEPRAGGGACHYCGHALPEGRPVTYCPNCGNNVTVRHCPACSTELEVGWHFCITCGRAMDETGLGRPSQ